MFGWIWPKPPLGAREKAWVETRMHVLADQLGIESLLNARVPRPTSEFSPATLPGSPADVQLILQRICGFLPVEAASVRVDVCDQESLATPPSQEPNCLGGSALCVANTLLEKPEMLVATLAQKLCRVLLQRRGGSTAQGAELDRVAELLSVFFGFGVFAANTATDRKVLPTRLVSYSLSLFAWLREEPQPMWASDLSPESAVIFRSGIRYLRRSGDSLLQMATVRRRYGALSVNELSQQLKTGTLSVKIAALWELAAKGPAASDAVPLVVECLRSREVDIRAEAARTLGSMDSMTPDVMLALTDALRDVHESVRAAAAGALGQLGSQAGDVVPELAQALQDESGLVVREAAMALCRFGSGAEPALNPLLEALRRALVDCNDGSARVLAAAVRTIAPNPETHLDAFFDEHDTDLRHAAFDLFTQHGEA